MGKPEIPEETWSVQAPEEVGHLDRCVRQRFPGASWNQVRTWIRGGNVLVDGLAVFDSTVPVPPGVQIVVSPRPSHHKRTASSAAALGSRPVVRPRKLIVHLDSQLVVVDKPSGISTVPHDETERDTLDRRVQSQIRGKGGRAKLLVVHRIDKETSGLVVFARTHHALERLKDQFRHHAVDRKYQALCHGEPRHATHRSRLVRDRGDGLRGSTQHVDLGRESVTHVRVLEKRKQASLIECELETGRTHQIRIHLAEAGHPLLGERVYSKGYAGNLLPAPRVMLHALTLGFDHPSDDKRLRFESELPLDFQSRWGELRGR